MPVPFVLLLLKGGYPFQLQASAEVLAVCGLGDEPRSASTEQSQYFLPGGINVENVLKIEYVAVTLICRPSNTEEFLGPQASQPAFEDEQPGVARRWQCNSQHAFTQARCLPNPGDGEFVELQADCEYRPEITRSQDCRGCGNAAQAAHGKSD
jgi:hypothetical protein